jgi:DNA polymerase III epsilon subunit-like protein
VNGFTREAAHDPEKQVEAELVASLFLAWAAVVSNQTLMAHNPHFDIGFLKAASRRAGRSTLFLQGALISTVSALLI